ncbi:MAG: serine protease [Fuerstiella sp.]
MNDAEFHCDQCEVIFFASLSPETATVICPECGYSHLVEAAFQEKSKGTVWGPPRRNRPKKWLARAVLMIIGLGLLSFCAMGIFMILQVPKAPLPAETITKTTESKRRLKSLGAHEQFRQRQQRAFNPTQTASMETSWSSESVRFYKTNMSVETGGSTRTYEAITRLESQYQGPFKLKPGNLYGTAIVLSPNGHLLVRANRFQQGRQLMVAVNKARIPAEILLHDRKNDLAILKVDANHLVTCRSGDFSIASEDQSFAILGYAQQAIFSRPSQTLLNAPAKKPEKRDLLRRIELDIDVDSSFDGAPVIRADGKIIGIAAVPLGNDNQKLPATVQPLDGLNELLEELSITLPPGQSSSLLSISEPVQYLLPVVVRDRYLGPLAKVRFETAMKATPKGTDFNSATGKKVVSAGTTEFSSTGQFSERHIGHTVFQLPHAIHELVFAPIDETGSAVWSTEELVQQNSSSSTFKRSPRFSPTSIHDLFGRRRPTQPAKPPQVYRDQSVCRRTAVTPEEVNFSWEFERHSVAPKPIDQPVVTATGTMVFDRMQKALSSIEKTYQIHAHALRQKQSTVRISAKLLTAEESQRWKTDFPIRSTSTSSAKVP